MTVTGVSAWHYAVKQINTTLYSLKDVYRSSHTHKVSYFVFRHMRCNRLNYPVHFITCFANGKSAKIAQFEANNKVAFATVPSPNVQLEVRCNQAVVTPSTEDLEELKEKLVQKRESAVHMLRGFGENAVAFDITFPSLLASERGREEVIEL